MRVAFDGQVFLMQATGGVSRYFIGLATQLHRLGLAEVQIHAPVHVNQYLDASGLSVVPSVYLRRRAARASASAWLSRMNGVVEQLSLRARSCDVVHGTYFRRRATAPRGTPHVITVHDMLHEQYPEWFADDNMTAMVKRRAVQQADHILCVSEHTRSELCTLLGVAPARTSVAYHGCELVAPDAATLSRLRGERPFVLHVGRRDGYKNFATLLRAYASCPGWRRELRLLCFGGGPLSTTEQAQCRALGLCPGSEVISVQGTDAVLAAHYATAAVFVSASRGEGFGMPNLEAMRAGCPVIAADIAVHREICADRAWYFPPDDPQALAAALHAVLADGDLRTRFVDRGREYGAQFTWRRCAEQTAQVYRMLCAS